jgi:hypothetical protein
MPRDDLVEMIVVPRDAVAAVAIIVYADAVEPGFGQAARTARDIAQGAREILIVKAVVTDEARDVDVAIVHAPALALPIDLDAKNLKPSARVRWTDKRRNVDDLSRFVVEQRAPAGAEESKLGQG